MALSKVQYNGDGVQTDFPVAFPYLKKDHIKVTVNGSDVSFTWPSDSTVRVSPAPANGTIVEVNRDTPNDARLVDFVNGSTLSADQLDRDSNQIFFIVQEAFDLADGSLNVLGDGSFGAGGRRISNGGDPTSPQDFATKNYVDTGAQSAVVEAKGYRDQAQTAATDAESAESSASTWATVSINFATTAEDTEVPGYPGNYSSLHHAAKSEEFATLSGLWAEAGVGVDVDGPGTRSALHYSSEANTHKLGAETARDAAETAQTNAETAETGAVAARDLAEQYRDTALTYRNTAGTYRDEAQDWATTAEDVQVPGSTEYSAKHYAAKAEGFAADAQAAIGDADTLDGFHAAAFSQVGHTHAIADVTNLQTTLNGKSDTSHSHSLATTVTEGFMSAADKTKLNGIEAGAEVNDVNSVNGYTGTVTIGIADISGLQADLDSKADASNYASIIPDADSTQRGLMTAIEFIKLAGIENGAEVNDVNSVNGQTGAVVLDANDVGAVSTSASFTVTDPGTTVSVTINGDSGDTAILALTEINEQYGFRFRYDGSGNTFHLESSSDSFNTTTEALSIDRGSSQVKFGSTPSVAGTNVSLDTHTHSNATTSSSGFMSGPDKIKLDALPSKAPQYARGERSTTLSIPNNVLTDVTWDSEDDPDGLLNGGTGAFVAPSGARFALVSANIAWAGNTSGVRFHEIIRDDGSSISAFGRERTAANSTNQECESSLSALVPVSTGDSILIRVLQGSGGNLDLQASSYCNMSVTFFF